MMKRHRRLLSLLLLALLASSTVDGSHYYTAESLAASSSSSSSPQPRSLDVLVVLRTTASIRHADDPLNSNSAVADVQALLASLRARGHVEQVGHVLKRRRSGLVYGFSAVVERRGVQWVVEESEWRDVVDVLRNSKARKVPISAAAAAAARNDAKAALSSADTKRKYHNWSWNRHGTVRKADSSDGNSEDTLVVNQTASSCGVLPWGLDRINQRGPATESGGVDQWPYLDGVYDYEMPRDASSLPPQTSDDDGQALHPVGGADLFPESLVFIVDSGVRGDHVQFCGNVSGASYDALRAEQVRATAGAHGVRCQSRVLPQCSENFASDKGHGPPCAYLHGQFWYDHDGHGSHVAGTIGGLDVGVHKTTRMCSLRVLDEKGEGGLSGMLSALDFIDHLYDEHYRPYGRRFRVVINMSLGFSSVEQYLDDRLNEAANGLNGYPEYAVVVAAGNSNKDACHTSPAHASGAVAVGASDVADNRLSFSNWGTCVKVFAPGENIVSVDRKSRTAMTEKGGTSMASPHVAGALMLMWDRNAAEARELGRTDEMTFTAKQAVQYMLDTATCNAVDRHDTTWLKQSAPKLLFVPDSINDPRVTQPAAQCAAVNCASTGACELQVPSNDECSGATVLPSQRSVRHSQVTRRATTSSPAYGGIPKCQGNSGGKDVWFSYRAPASGKASFSTCGSTYDTQLYVHSACPTGSQSHQLVCHDDVRAIGCKYTSTVTMDVVSGRTYLLRVTGYMPLDKDGALVPSETEFGALLLSIDYEDEQGDQDDSCANQQITPVTHPCTTCMGTIVSAGLASDDCGSAPVLRPTNGSCLSRFHGAGHTDRSQQHASVSPPTGLCSTSSAGSRDVFYSIISDQPGSLDVSLCLSTFDTVISVHRLNGSETCADMGTLDCNDDSCGQQSELYGVPIEANVRYWIRIAGLSTADKGVYQFTAEFVPSLGVDSDNDGLPDSIDDCPLDPFKSVPGRCGCGVSDEGALDGDGDGVFSFVNGSTTCVDQCDNDPKKTTPGLCGCGANDTGVVDADGDGVLSFVNGSATCIDQCDNDANKTSPGVCGCGFSDAGVTNATQCNVTVPDECPYDPLKTKPGLCGCGVSDVGVVDQDGDGVLSYVPGSLMCSDECDLDAGKTEPGVCGCGFSDLGVVDGDNDGIYSYVPGSPTCTDRCDDMPGVSTESECESAYAKRDRDRKNQQDPSRDDDDNARQLNIGLGVGIGAVLVALVGVLMWQLRRRQRFLRDYDKLKRRQSTVELPTLEQQESQQGEGTEEKQQAEETPKQEEKENVV